MVITGLKRSIGSTAEDEADLLETLSDVQLACNTAVDILNDLLSFEKLESGILELHRQDVPAVQFISECVLIFNPQAREKGVSLDLLLTVDDATLVEYPGAVPLLYNDQFSCDRFKLEQVVRSAQLGV
jgi:signal transduction histidine kinase